MKKKEMSVMGIIVLIVLALIFVPWRNINWGKVRWLQAETVTVIGEAKSIQKNQIADFSAGVDAVGVNKDAAVKEVNTKVEALIKAVKDFGIKEEDIKTQNMSVYQQEESYLDNGVQKSRKGQWRVSNSVEIILRNVDKASELATLLTSSGATNVYGPNFRMDDTNSIEKTLYDGAIQDAKDKAILIAKAAGRKLGKVVMVNDSGTTSNIYPMYTLNSKADGIGGGVPTEIGSQTVSKSLTVSFEFE